MDNISDLKSRVNIYQDAYCATKNTHAIVLCTEWDEFMVCYHSDFIDILIR